MKFITLPPLKILEQSTADADVDGEGQIWVKTATPNELWFTDDAGTDVQLTGAAGNGPQLQSPTPTTSGTSHDYTSIPSWAKRITIMFKDLSTNGTSPIIILLGDSGGLETTGYSGRTYQLNSTINNVWSTVEGIAVVGSNNASYSISGTITLSLADASTNLWTATVITAATVPQSGAGYKALSAVLTQLRLTTDNGTDTFDAGSFNISWE